MKKFLSLLLALALVFALVACSNEKDTTSESDTSTPITQTQTESTDTNDTQTTDSDTTDESSSDAETPSNSTPTSTETSKPTTSNKENTISSKESITVNTTSSNSPATSIPSQKKLSEITINTLPQKTIYKIGDLIDTNGLSIKAIYSDGSNEVLYSGYTINGFSSQNEGTTTINVYYENKSTEFTVKIINKISLFDLKPYIGSKQIDSNVTDNFGNTYDKAFTIHVNHYQGSLTGSDFSYDIAQKYSRFSAVIFGVNTENAGGGCLKIYGDGNLIYDNSNINSSCKPTYIELNISGVSSLTFNISAYGGWSGFGLAEANLYIR